MRNYHIEEDKSEITHFQLIFQSISDHHHRDDDFIQKIKKIIQYNKEKMMKYLAYLKATK